jgi:DNA polymerase elongation subunit (family B)
MNVYEIMEQSSGAVVHCFRKNEKEIATELLRNLVAKAFEEGQKAGAVDAGQYVLEYLSDLYEGVQDTDIWSDYFDEEEASE